MNRLLITQHQASMRDVAIHCLDMIDLEFELRMDDFSTFFSRIRQVLPFKPEAEKQI
jgi:hypothetical protein